MNTTLRLLCAGALSAAALIGPVPQARAASVLRGRAAAQPAAAVQLRLMPAGSPGSGAGSAGVLLPADIGFKSPLSWQGAPGVLESAAAPALPAAAVPALPLLGPVGQAFAPPELGDAGAGAGERPVMSLLGRVSRALHAGFDLARFFDAALRSEDSPVLDLDPAPSVPDSGTGEGRFLRRFDLPGAGRRHELSADPTDLADVEAALRRLVDADPGGYGVSGADLAAIQTRRVPGTGGRADTVYASFRQRQDGLEVQGSYLGFTIKVIHGRPLVVSTTARLFPELKVDAVARFSERELRARARSRLEQARPDAGLRLEHAGRAIVHAGGAWRPVELYRAAGASPPLAAAVDRTTGEAFAWDPNPRLSGRVEGRGVEKGPAGPEAVLTPVPMPHLLLRLADGRTVVTDHEGRFTLDAALPEEARRFTATLTGSYAKVANFTGASLSIEGVLEPGREVTVMFNPTGAEETDIAQVNAYRFVNLAHDWLKARGVTSAELDIPIPVDVNIDERCNAFYTPGNPSLNFFKSNGDCANTAYGSVIMHEYGHFVDDRLGGISDGGLSEGWGDILSMFILRDPVIGEGFLKRPIDGATYIRHGENTYRYQPWHKVHEQGQAWGGFAWKLRKSFIAALGEAEGSVLVESLILPVFYAKPYDIPAAMAQVLLNDMDAEGRMPHEAEIRATAKIHGITIKGVPGKVSALLSRAILPREGGSLAGWSLDEAPAAPEGGRPVELFRLPGAGAQVLEADPSSEKDVERALRDLIRADPARYGVSDSELATVHVRRVPGQGRQADTIYALFRQKREVLELEGSALSMTVKVIEGKPNLVASTGKLYPGARVDATPRFSEAQLEQKALERLGTRFQGRGLKAGSLGRKVVFIKGSWRAASLYLVEGGPAPVAAAVDVATGEAFAWDSRASSLASGRIAGRSVAKGPARPDAPMTAQPLPGLTVSLGNGRTTVTDGEGRFTAPEDLGPGGGAFSAGLSGRWAQIHNVAGRGLLVGGSLSDGKETAVVFNPEGRSEEAVAQVNAYLLATRAHDWAKSHGLDDSRVDRVLPVNVNIDDECNAYYMPGSPSLNFFKSSERCANTAYDAVVLHEYGHFLDDMIGGIVNSGLSEGWGDIFAMFILDHPVIGEGFYKKPRDGVDYIRTGENAYQYGREDEAHDQGQAWGGFAWKLRKALKAELGDAAGAALAEALVIPTLFAKASNIPAAMRQVLLNDMDASGAMPHEAAIRAAAKAHGIRLQRNWTLAGAGRALIRKVLRSLGMVS
ncbi:MAG: hypothetical protein HY924_12095 [Elusimicrobia bacterium]|nr:hypothetical protein [Elusimicrobiota bacterium]